MIRTMDLPVAIGTTAVDGKDIQSLPGRGRMTRKHMNVALLAQQMNARRQELGIVRTVRRVTVQAILTHGRMVPKKRSAFFGVAGVTHVVDGVFPQHLARFTAVRIVAGGTTDLHVAHFGAKQMGRPLEQRLSLFDVATEASFLDGRLRQHMFRQPRTHEFGDFRFGLIGKTGGHSF